LLRVLARGSPGGPPQGWARRWRRASGCRVAAPPWS